jgi:uncharacterized paraquat-inducible protein A
VPYRDIDENTIVCPHCGQEVPHKNRCPNCGQYLPRREKKKWKIPKMTPTEIFLAILGFIMLMIGLVAV